MSVLFAGASSSKQRVASLRGNHKTGLENLEDRRMFANSAPAGADGTVIMLEDTPYTFTTTDFGFTDPNDSPAHSFLAVQISTLPSAGTLTNNGVPVTVNQFVSVADITAGLLKFTPAANASGTNYASLRFKVQDNGGTAGGGVDIDPTPNRLRFNVTAVNDAPSGTNRTLTILEDGTHTFTAANFGFTDTSDSPANSLAAVKISSLPTAGTLTNNGAAVSAGQTVSVTDITAGRLRFTPAANANGTGYASFTFQVQDNGGTANGGVDLDATPNTITFNVTAVNDAPSGANSTVTILEDSTYTFTTVNFGFSDTNDSPAHSLLAVRISSLPGRGSLTNNGVAVAAGQYITVASITSGLLKYTPAANGSGVSYTSFNFQVQDNGGTTSGGVNLDASQNTITFNVTAVNDAPSGTNRTLTILEDGTHTFTAANFGFTDTSDSPANSLAAVKISTLPTAGTLTNNGAAVSAGQTVSVADITAGRLRFTPAANANGTGYASFTFQVQDNGGTANGGVDLDQTPNTITFNVTAVNDAPSGANSTVTILEDSTYTFTTANFGFSDVNDSPAHSLLAVRISSLPGRGSLTNNGVAVVAGQYITVADITAGLLKYTPAANGSGVSYTSFTFQVQDNGGTTSGGINLDASPNTITFNVTEVNNAPSGTDKNVILQEDTTYTLTALDFGFSDPNNSPANSFFAVRISSLPAAGTLTNDGVAVSAGQFISEADITAGLLRFTPAANANGTGYASFTFQVQDDGGTVNGGIDLDQTPNTITFDVSAVNDAPAGADKIVTMLEDASYTFTLGDFGFSDSNDSPANNFSAVKVSSLPTAGTLTNNGMVVTAGQFVSMADILGGGLTFIPLADAHGVGYSSFTFQVQDDGGTADGGVDLDATPNTITFNVTPVNDAPSGADSSVNMLQGTTYTFTVADFGFSDVRDTPANNLAAVRISSLPLAGKLTNNGSAVSEGQFISVADILAGKLKYTPKSSGSGDNYASFTFQVRDDGGTAYGGVNLDPTPNRITFNVTSTVDSWLQQRRDYINR